jgi:phosphomannomutase
MMFTASNNHPPYCGIKYYPDYADLAIPEITYTIVANIEGAFDASCSGGQKV